MRRGVGAALAILAGLVKEDIASAQNSDVDLIPSEVRDEPTAPAPRPVSSSSLRAKWFLENSATLESRPRAVPVPYPGSRFDYQDRTSLDLNLIWRPSPGWTVVLGDRLNVVLQDNQDVLSWQTVQNNLREGYVTWDVEPGIYLEAGRINVRNGVALGYNPTDFFKTRSLVGQASLDPAVLRENRLGTLMLRGETIWNGGSASIAFAPRVARRSPIASTTDGLDPRFDATNAEYRLLGTLSFELADLNPTALYYAELHRSKLGLSMSRPIGNAIVAYGEWAGGPEENLASRAIGFGQATGTIPPGVPVLPSSGSRAFRNDVASGFSWTIGARVTVNAEYHFHQAGFSKQDWRDWFAVGGSPGAPAAAPGELWYVRGYASDQQEPVPAHQVFLRADWPKAFTDDLGITGLAFVDLLDGSVLTQLSGKYYVSDAWTVAAYASANLGAARTERGSFPQSFGAIFDVILYL